MSFKGFVALGLLFTLTSGVFVPFTAFAEDGEGGDEDVLTDDSVDDSVDELLDDDEVEDLEDVVDDSDQDEGENKEGEEVYYDDSEEAEDADFVPEEEGEVLVETVDTVEVDDDVVKEYADAILGGATTNLFLSVRWGYFGADHPDFEVTDWDGTVGFDNGGVDLPTVALPVKMLRFEKGEDGIDFDNTTVDLTTFESDIHDSTDGLLFRVKTNLEGAGENGYDHVPSVTFNAVSFPGGVRVSLPYLLETGEYTVDAGDYQVVFNVWTSDEWIAGEAAAQASEMERGVTDDAEKGSWYEHFMNFSVQNGFFGGDRHSDGRPMGTIRPGASITRLELIKVASELARRLDLGTGLVASDCDTETVVTDASTDWMGDVWARPYVQCIEDSGLAVTLLDEVIAGDMGAANAPAKRWEVVLTVFELLGIDPTQDDVQIFPDLDSVSADAQAAIEESADFGVVEGYSDGHFRPENDVNRAEMFKIVSLFYEALSL